MDSQHACRGLGRSPVQKDVEKLFIADGDALILGMDHWIPILEHARRAFPRLRRVSCYAMARNILAHAARASEQGKRDTAGEY